MDAGHDRTLRLQKLPDALGLFLDAGLLQIGA
jgi:hypothetical protein